MKVKKEELSAGIMSVLPLFYIGWSDSVLSPSEMKIIHQKINQLTHLTKEDKDYLIRYSDPANPPTESLFKSWVDQLRSMSNQIPASEKSSISALGIALAKVSTKPSEAGIYDAPKTLAALEEIEQALGIYTHEDLIGILGQLGAHQIVASEKQSSFDIDKMGEILDGDRIEVKHRCRKLLRDPFYSIEKYPTNEEHRASILNMLNDLSARGYGLLSYPLDCGGKSDMLSYIAVFETLARHDLSLTIKFGVQFGLFGGAILGLGTQRHHKYLNDVGKAKLLGCFAMTETGHGSNVKDLETTAIYIEEEQTIVINTPHKGAGKEYIGNTIHGRMAVVFAQLIVKGYNYGIHAIMVPYRDDKGSLLPGIMVEDCGYKMGLNGVDNGRLWFDHVKVPKDNLLNRYGDIDQEGNYKSTIENPSKRFFTMLGALVGGRICVGIGSLSAAKTALAIAVKYGLKRRQFAPIDGVDETIILDYPSHQHRLIPYLVKNYCYHLTLNMLAEQYVVASEDEMRKIETKAAGLKAMATWISTATIQECREACGGKGYLWENRFTDLKGDSDIFTTFEGDNTVLMQLVAKGLLTEFKQSFHDEGFTAVVRYLYNKLGNTLVEINPYQKRNTSIDHLTSIEFHQDALRYREKKMLLSLSDRMRKYLSKKLNPHEAFLKCQIHMIELAKAYVERLVYRNMVLKLSTLSDGTEKRFLEKVNTYYTLTIIQENKGWYLESDYMDGSKTKAIRRLHQKLTQELRNDIGAMVEAFKIPDETLAAKII